MALAIANAAPLRPDIKLSQALSDYEAILSTEQRQSYSKSPPGADAVMALTCDIDRQSSGRKTRRCGARLDSFLKSVKGFTSVVDLIISSSGNPIAGGVWGAVKIAVQIASGFETYFDSLSKLLMNVGLSSPRLERYAYLYPASKSLQKELCNYFSVVVNLCTRIISFVRKPFTRQIASAMRKPFDDEFGTFQKELLSIGTSVKEEVSLASKQLQNLECAEQASERKANSISRATDAVFQRKTANELAQARKWRGSRAKYRFLDSCSRYNFETALNQARKKGASTWIFNTKEYQQWKSRSSSSTILCSGIVGAGKTVLCANVIEDLSLKGPLDSSVSYFFCRSDEAASMKAREILGSLARQLLENEPFEKFNLNQTDPNVGNFPLGTEQILSNTLRLLPQHRCCFVVLDGLDECQYEEVKALFESIQSLLRSSNHVIKLFVTGRSSFASKISEQLGHDFRVHFTPSNNGPEISRFIELALEDALESNRLNLRNPNLIVKIQDALEKGAQEMFLWVQFQIDSICAQNTDYDIVNSLKDLPKGLPATFRRILRQLKQLPSANPSLGQKIFEIVAAAQRPLTLDELREAISVTPGDSTWNQSKLVNDELRSLESCGSFIVVDEELSTVHFAHSSIKRYLSSELVESDIWDYHIDLSQADVNLGAIAITYLSLDVLGNEITKSVGHSQSLTASIPSFVVKSALSKRETVNKVALAILRGRNSSVNKSGFDLERSASLARAANTQMQQTFSFLPYCQEYWLHHGKYIQTSRNQRVHELWQRLVNGTLGTVELPWAPDSLVDLGDRFLGWIRENRHDLLIREAIHQLWHRDPFVDNLRQLENLLEKLLNKLPNENVLHNLQLGPTSLLMYKLHAAVICGYESVARLALDEGADINAQGHTHLGVTFSTGKESIARLFATKRTDMALLDENYGTAMHIAAAVDGLESMIKFLLQNGANVNACIGSYGTPLMVAVVLNNLWALEALVTAGADLNIPSEKYGTALIAAVTIDNREAVIKLLDYGANPNYSDPLHERPLRVAARRGNQDIVEQLLDHGAHVAVYFNANYSTVEQCRKLYKTTKPIARLLYDATHRNTS